MPPDLEKLGIIAGGGRLPELLAESCREGGRPYFAAVLKGQGDPAQFPADCSASFRLGATGGLIKRLKAEGVTEIVLSGTVRRPGLSELFPDLWTARFLARSRAFDKGDDGLLRAIVDVLEREEGFKVLAPEDIAPGLLAPAGQMGAVAPSEAQRRDIEVGMAAARDLGRRDVGQAVVVRDGRLVAEEGTEGTEAMLSALAARGGAAGGVLVKAMKPQQERRVDLPTIGPDTVGQARAAGLAGVAVETGGALVLDRDDLARAADAAGLFVFGAGA